MITHRKIMEAIITIGLAVVGYAVGYGILIQKVNGIKTVNDDRYKHLNKEIDDLKIVKETTNDTLNEINVSLQILKNDIGYIKKNLDKIEKVIERVN